MGLERLFQHWCLPLKPRKCFLLISARTTLPCPIPFNPIPAFLRATFDRRLCLYKYIFPLKIKLFLRRQALHCTVFLNEPSKESLPLLHKAFLQPSSPVLHSYGLPFLCIADFTTLKRFHLTVSRTISCCLLFFLL